MNTILKAKRDIVMSRNDVTDYYQIHLGADIIYTDENYDNADRVYKAYTEGNNIFTNQYEGLL